MTITYMICAAFGDIKPDGFPFFVLLACDMTIAYWVLT